MAAILRSFCAICATSIRKVNSRSHIRAHLYEKCPLCGFTETVQDVMMHHLVWHLEEQYECAICGDIYPNFALFKAHQDQHKAAFFTQKVVYDCSACSQSFTCSNDDDFHESLQRHQAQHTQVYEDFSNNYVSESTEVDAHFIKDTSREVASISDNECDGLSDRETDDNSSFGDDLATADIQMMDESNVNENNRNTLPTQQGGRPGKNPVYPHNDAICENDKDLINKRSRHFNDVISEKDKDLINIRRRHFYPSGMIKGVPPLVSVQVHEEAKKRLAEKINRIFSGKSATSKAETKIKKTTEKKGNKEEVTEKRKRGRPRKSTESKAEKYKNKPTEKEESEMVDKCHQGRPTKSKESMAQEYIVETTDKEESEKAAVVEIPKRAQPIISTESKVENSFENITEKEPSVAESVVDIRRAVVVLKRLPHSTIIKATNHQLKASLTAHIKRKENRKIDGFPCGKCNATFKKDILLKVHERVHNGKGQYPCLHCSREFKLRVLLKYHLKKVHKQSQTKEAGNTHVATVRRKQLESSSKITETVAESTDNDDDRNDDDYDPDVDPTGTEPSSQISCEYCRKEYGSREGLKYHLNVDTGSAAKCKGQLKKKDRTSKFSCYVCHKGYSTKQGLRYHLNTYHGEEGIETQTVAQSTNNDDDNDSDVYTGSPPEHKDQLSHTERSLKFSCEFCQKAYGSTKGLRFHLKTCHGVEAIDIPPPEIKESEAVAKHKTEFGKDDDYDREINTGSPTKSNGQQTTERSSKFHCEFCHKGYTWRKGLKGHIKRFHGEKATNIPSPQVDKSQTAAKSISGSGNDDENDSEVNIGSPGKSRESLTETKVTIKFSCELCHKGFATLIGLTNHLKTMKEIGVPLKTPNAYRKFSKLCSVCGMKLTNYNYQYHMSQHENLIECPTCHLTFLTKRKMKHHMIVKKCHVCLECGQRFNEPYKLKQHLLFHTGEKPWQCNECGNLFRTKAFLDLHLRVHRGDKRYTCTFCGHKSGQNSGHRRHVRTHTGLKPNKCSVCGKAFSDNTHLKRHMRIHTQEKYECPLCGKKITDKSNVMKHIKVHEKRGEWCPNYTHWGKIVSDTSTTGDTHTNKAAVIDNTITTQDSDSNNKSII